jgi:outer membrane lipase/esterase
MGKQIAARITLLLGLVLQIEAYALNFSDIVVFGDSLSDSGNVSLATRGTVPGSPYFQGRFTNGLNYADRLALKLGLTLTPSLAGGDNFAFGGARTDRHPSGQPFDVLSQVNAFKSRVNNADVSALYVLYAGVNNFQDIIDLVIADPGNAAAIGLNEVTNAIGDITVMLSTLEAVGARTILVPNAPNLGAVPRVTERENTFPGISAFVTSQILAFNAALDMTLGTFTNLNIIRLDTFGLSQDVLLNPASFGLTDVTSRCYTGDDLNFTGGGTVCSNPDSFFFWDGIHPTAKFHELLANRAFSAVVAEPSTLLLIGIAALSLLGRSRRRRKLLI